MISSLYLNVGKFIYSYISIESYEHHASEPSMTIFLLITHRAEQTLSGSFRPMSELENFWLVAHERKEGSARSTARNARLVANLAQHAQAQREGKHLTLVSAIQKGLAVDKRFFQAKAAVQSVGVSVKYGNNSMTGRAKQSIIRNKASAAKKKDKGKEKEIQPPDEDTLQVCNNLAELGADKDLLNRYLELKIQQMESH